MASADEIRKTVREFIVREFLQEEDAAELGDSTPLITGGILDSIATLKLVTFLEETYRVEFKAHETDAEYLDTIDDIAHLIESKL
jgi:acyl carrier protein